MLNEGEVGRRSQSMTGGGVGFRNHLRNKPEGFEGVTGGGGREPLCFAGGVWGGKDYRSWLEGRRE